MADVYTHAFRFPAGLLAAQDFELGPPAASGDPERTLTTAQPPTLYQLRVGYLMNQYPPAPEVFTASILVPGAGQLVAGIEVPFVLDVAAPVRLTLQPRSAPAAERIVCADIARGCCGNDYMPQATAAVVAPANTPLQPWAVAVFVANTGATAEWVDSAGAVLGTFPAGIVVPRPRLATQVRVTTANSLVTQFFAL